MANEKAKQVTVTETVFERLSKINVNEKVEKKNGLTYLSWAWAWGEVKKACPDAGYKIGEVEYDPDLGFMCHTEVTIEGETLAMWLPVMDGANKSMKKVSYTYKGTAWKDGKKVEVDKVVEAATTFDINKTIMRCLVKNLAMFGLGLYIFAGEDLPESETPPAPINPPAPVAKTATPKAEQKLVKLVVGSDNWNKVLAYVTDNKALGLEEIVRNLQKKYEISSEVKFEIQGKLS